ncbi:MAG TPA: S8 family serine peptidase [Verrucomicrobiota bacterium]|nr:S8 family serine peptidase [Verrucomicrobiota bacterium]
MRGTVGLLLLCLGLSSLLAETKHIRLRNELITTTPARAGVLSRSTVADAPVSGLYLIQFTNRLDAGWRQELLAAGVELLHYVPDDAFVAHLDQVRLSEIRRRPYVQWLGLFQPQHKVHPALLRRIPGQALERFPIKLLARSQASNTDMASIVRVLRGTLHYRTLSMGTLMTGETDFAGLMALSRSPAVLWIEGASRMKLLDEVATKILAGENDVNGSLATVHELGFDGRGVTVAVADSGLDSGDLTLMHPDLEGRVAALFAYDGLADASDEHSHGTHCAGIIAGNAATGETDESGAWWGLGVAPGAQIVAQRIFDGSGEYRPPSSFEQMTRDAVRSGAYIGSNSWGDDTAGQYDLSAAEFDALVRDADALTPGEQAYVLEFSAGNSGPATQTIGSPAVAKNVIATGATQNNRYEFPIYGEGQEVMADFSSRGPCEDGRFKPDVAAPGTWIASLRSIYADDNNAWGSISDRYLYQGGTSQAGPHVSGACAIFVQWYRVTHNGSTPSPALVKAALINSADDMATAEIPDTGGLGGLFGDAGEGGTIIVGDTGPVPNHDEGWGRVNLENLIASERRFKFLDQGAGLVSGGIQESRVLIGNQQSLKVTLVYTDVPGLPAAIPALVNDLDLEVIAPDGRLFRGNAFAEGESVAGTVAGDSINNVEAVHLAQPQAGEYVVRVRGRNVVKDVHNRATGIPEQDFALVISGQLPLPGEGVVSWDREAYRAPIEAQLRLVDEQLSAAPTVVVRISSSSQPGGQNLTLNRISERGEFRGVINLVTNAIAGIGELMVQDGDELVLTYSDAEPAGERTAKAVVDLQSPASSEVTSSSRFGRTTISWLTGEPATSLVMFGTTNAVTNAVADAGYRSQHVLQLPLLEPDTTYFFYVVSTDKAGNTSTNNNDGRFFRFIATRPATALLIYTPESLFAEGGLLGDTPYPGIETWTGPLDQLGVDYEIWDMAEREAAPSEDELKGYRLVLWRPEELTSPLPNLVSALRSYTQEGGALFVASFDLLTRLSEIQQGAFASNVLHVASYSEDQGALSIQALAGEPVGGDIALDLNYDEFPSGFIIDLLGIDWTVGPDHLQAGTNTAAVFIQEDGRTVGLKYPRTGLDSANGRVVYYSFALEAVPADGDAPNNRATLLGQALEFLLPGLQGLSSIAFEQSAYRVPSAVLMEAIDSRQAGRGFVEARLSIGTGAGQTVRLDESVRQGVFRGRATLVPQDAPEESGRFPAQHGDQMKLQYIDTTGRAVLTSAQVDTVSPNISAVIAEPAYNEAIVSWETDKPTDALVKFAESGSAFPINRTAYSAELATYHEVQLVGLLPDRDYVFEVVSRDVAGNIASDDRDGQYYLLRTLKPLNPPWLDNLETGQTGWAVLNMDLFSGAIIGDDDEEGGGGFFSSASWQRGDPAGSTGIQAHSGTRCWATNLRNEPVDLAFSDLITPAISLVGGQQAVLRWWQFYDFSTASSDPDDEFGDISIEMGQVAVSTDNGATWKDIYAIQEESSFGEWELIEIDLSKFVGQVIRVRFNYQLFSFIANAKTGWMIDDLSLEMGVLAQSVIHVSNNLAKAEFTLTGPVQLTASGRQVSTNVPPGEYTISWSPVPYYTTPPPQTGMLTTNAALSFTGLYTFPDFNTNSLSDLWETQYFGSVNPGHPASWDSDRDGATDGQEFLAGTSPADAASVLELRGPFVQPNGTTRFEWTSSIGCEYALEVSHDLDTWQSVSETSRGNGQVLAVTLPVLDPRLSYFFRIRVTP